MSIQQRQTVSIPFAQIAAGTDEVWYWTNPHPQTLKVEKLYFTSMTARTAHDTNYTDISVEVEGTEIASEATTTADTGDLTAGGELVLALTKSGSELEVAQGETIAFKKTDAGTGLALDGTFTAALVAVRV